MEKLTKEQAIVISAYTGVLICEFSDLHKAVEEKLGEPIWTHEFPVRMESIKEAFKDDFLSLAPNK